MGEGIFPWRLLMTNADGYFFSVACQLVMTVSGTGGGWSAVRLTRNHWPAETSHPRRGRNPIGC
jgi:hypothetical protein